MRNSLKVLLCACSAATVMFGCTKKNDFGQKSENQVSSPAMAQMADVFTPNVNVSVEDGYLVFDSYDAVDSFIHQTLITNPVAVNEWENSVGFSSLRHIVYNVMVAEDSINTLFESGALSGDEVFSPEYTQAMSDSVIKMINDPTDGSEYWGIATNFDYYQPVTNKFGLIKIAGEVHKYYNDGTLKIATDPTFPIAQFDQVVTTTDHVIVVPFTPIPWFPPVPVASPIVRPYTCKETDAYARNNNWKNVDKKHRVKVWLSWSSAKNFGPRSCGDFQGVQVSFKLKTLAQHKNVWGNWVQNQNYWPSITFSIVSRDYTFVSDWNCGLNITSHPNGLPNFVSYSAVPGQTYTYSGNGMVLSINPDKSGWYVYDNTVNSLFHCTPVLTKFEMSATYAGLSGWGFQ